MINPIVSKLTSNPLTMINAMKNPEAFFNQLMQNNPQFSQFVNENKNKSVEEICRNYGIDPAMLNQFIK